MNYNAKTLVAILKYMIIEHVSTRVVISGDAIIAGSRPICFASSGNIQPINLEMITVAMSENEITRASPRLWYIKKMRAPFAVASTMPTSKETSNSFHTTRKKSWNRISSSAIPRMTSVELWEPQFPPVSISIGMKETSSGMAANAFSYFVIIVPVMIEENIKISSHGILRFAWENAEVSK